MLQTNLPPLTATKMFNVTDEGNVSNIPPDNPTPRNAPIQQPPPLNDSYMSQTNVLPSMTSNATATPGISNVSSSDPTTTPHGAGLPPSSCLFTSSRYLLSL